MEVKKEKEMNLEKKRYSFLLVGFVFSLGIVLSAFEYTTFDEIVYKRPVSPPIADIPAELPPPFIVPAPPPPPPKPSIVIDIVPDKVDVPENVVFEPKPELDPTPPVVEDIPRLPENLEEDTLFLIVEEMPSFPGGETKLFEFLQGNVVYPPQAFNAGIEGVVYVSFVVDKSGRVTDAKVLKGVEGGCSEEALRVIKSMPIWKPGKQRGKPVSVQYSIPLRFGIKNIRSKTI